uniref:Uncharacterized protein n=1 Tax=Ditylenchus dipsaci TaxID=166011 RepID=A0A915D612_9BILA
MSSARFSEATMPKHIWYIGEGPDFVEVELPEPFKRSVEMMIDTYGDGALMVDAEKVGTNDGGRIIRLIGTDEEIVHRLGQISNSIVREMEASRRPYNADEIEFLRGYFVYLEEEKNNSAPVDLAKVDALVQQDIEDRKKVLAQNPKGYLYTKPYY